MNVEALTAGMLIIFRYILSNSGFLGVLIGLGFTLDDATALNENISLVVVGLIMQFGPPLYAWWRRPSPKAMQAAKAIDKTVPKEDAVVIKTPPGVPDIIVGGETPK